MLIRWSLVFCSLSVMVLSHAGAQDSPPGKLVNPRTQVLKVKELPPLSGWVEDTEGGIRARSEMALLEGVEALENMAAELLAKEMRDKDGRHTTPIFFEGITGEGGRIDGRPRLEYQLEVCAEWRRRFPQSRAAMLAEARLCSLQAHYAIYSGRGVADADDIWKVAGGFIDRSMALLEQCRDFRKVDPAWYAAYFQVVVKSDLDRPAFDRLAAELVNDFPGDSLSLSKAVKCLYAESFGKPGEWEPWLRGLLGNQSPEDRAKHYARVLYEIGVTDGYGSAGPAFLWHCAIDAELLASGMDLLSKQYPDSVWLGSAHASAAATCLRDRQLAFKYLKLAGGHLHMDHIGGKGGYDSALAFIGQVPWDLGKVGGPRIIARSFGDDPEFSHRMDEAAARGPAALEQLIRTIRSTDGGRDEDGLYYSERFFGWFREKPRNIAQEKRRILKQELVAKWSAEFPASPFAKLASASYWAHSAWNARGGYHAGAVEDVQWKGFGTRLGQARKDLMACRELRDDEPVWSSVALMIMKGEGMDREEFDALSDHVFIRFPECTDAVLQTMDLLQPKWYGKPGEWEPWLRARLKDLPEEQRSMAYARAMITVLGYARSSKTNLQNVFGGKKPDVLLLLGGLRLLAAKFPDSKLIANAQAMHFGLYSEESDTVYKALQKMDGTIDLRVWSKYSAYEPCENWIARLRTEAALKAAR
ncbi:DUF4034 domain-containing protein [Luteolibacter sp. SL250]|uniref:DUF4034 domain-containing protein n=1 Tax=Luteolibacter sp. SL250 TaxID=2995170 RepID=UPI00226FD523|nr:DUF4034 domain-containing protein [Luteolibacter sp. SL250]WAC21329.1 DUF4034 domain-containing protein [Luteolibacter sp. SL250]